MPQSPDPPNPPTPPPASAEVSPEIDIAEALSMLSTLRSGVEALQAAEAEIAMLRRWLLWAYQRLPMVDRMPLRPVLGIPDPDL